MNRRIPPSASAVYWVLKANEEKLHELRRVDLVELSMMSDQSWENGVKQAIKAGLISKDQKRNKYDLT